MAKLNDTSKGILGKASEKIGSYQEAPGGGKPLPKGSKAPSPEWVKEHRKMQPRDEEGQFTYNSVNGKGLAYGPSRGTTVPPFLRGIKLTYCAPGTKLKIEGEDGSIKIKLMTIDMTVEEIVHRCKEYIESEEGFAGMGEGSSITKKGRKSESEKTAEAGQAGYVDPKTLSEGTQKEMAEAKAKYDAENSADKEPVNPTVDGYKVLTDILESDGSTTRVTPKRYWERKGETGTSGAPVEKTYETEAPTGEKSTFDKGYEGTGDEVASRTASDSKDKVLGSMGLTPEDVKETEDVTFDVEAAKADPKAFYAKHKDTIKSMVDDFNSKYPDKKIDHKVILQAIKNGKIKDLASWKKKFGKK